MRRCTPCCLSAMVLLLGMISFGLTPTMGVAAGAGESDPPSSGGTDGWLHRAKTQIEESEYRITWQDASRLGGLDASWQAPNRSQNLRTYFTPGAIRVVPRTEADPSWEWGLSLVGYGRGATVRPVATPSLSPEEKRIDYDRGDVVEWYVNDRRGLEQGFTLHLPPDEMPATTGGVTLPGARSGQPAGAVEGDPAYLVLLLRGDLTPVPAADGRAIDFHRGTGMQVLHYTDLVVRDAMERELPSWMETFPSSSGPGIRLVFDDRGAIYPVTVDPLAKSAAWTAEGNQEDAHFGEAVAGAGDVNGDGYDDVIVGARLYDAGQTDQGAVFVFHGSASGLASAPAWMADGPGATQSFGHAVAGAGDVNADGYDDIVVGDPWWSSGGMTNRGAAFVYHGSPTGLDNVACDPDGIPGNGDECRADADWWLEGSQNLGYFGHSVATAGRVNVDAYDDVMIGMPYGDNNQGDEGFVLVYRGSSSGLEGSHFALLEPNEAGDHLGLGQTSIAAAGDLNGDGFDDLILGVPDAGTSDRDGRVFLSHGPTLSDWVQLYNVNDGDESNDLGASVAGGCDVNGDGHPDVIVGNWLGDYSTYWHEDSGEVLVFHGSASGPDTDPDWRMDTTQKFSHFGYSVACAGNVNGDGCCDDTGDDVCDRDCSDRASCCPSGGWHDYDDVIVGAPDFDPAAGNEAGAAFLFHGSSLGLSMGAADFPPGNQRQLAPEWLREGDQAGARLGIAVAGAGDVNGDGYADVIVGAVDYDGDLTAEGAAFLHHGAPEENARQLAWHLLGNDGDVCAPAPGSCEVGTAGITVYGDSNAPSLGVSPDDNRTSVAAGPGPYPGSVVISNGRAQDLGKGSMDWWGDGMPDLVRFRLKLIVPYLVASRPVETLRFTTQYITSDPEDTVRFRFEVSGLAGEVIDLNGIMGLGAAITNPIVSHAIRVTERGGMEIDLDFEIADGGGDGLDDSALILSRFFFSGVELPEGADLDAPPDGLPDVLSNPAPSDVSESMGTYSFQKQLLSVPGIGMPFAFSIRYNSASVQSGALGEKWTHSYESTAEKTTVTEDGSATPECVIPPCPVAVDLVIVRLGSGRSEYFRCPNAISGTPPDQVRTCGDLDAYEPKYAGMYSSLLEGGGTDPDTDPKFTYVTKDDVTYKFTTASPEADTYLLDRIEDPNDNTVRLDYDANKRLEYVLDTRGKTITFGYDAADLLSSVTHAAGGSASLAFDHAASVNPEGEIVHRLAGYTDPNGYRTSFAYDDHGNLLTCTDDDDVVFVANEYEEFQGMGIEQKGDRVNRRRNAHPGDPGLEMHFTGDTVETVDRAIEPGTEWNRGRERSLHDVKGRVVEQKVFLGRTPAGAMCDPSDPVDEFCDPRVDCCWALTETDYDEENNPTWTRDPLLGETLMEYANGNLTCRRDPDGDVVVMRYDPDDNLIYRATHPTKGVDCVTAAAECALPDIQDQPIAASSCWVSGFVYDPAHNLEKEYDSEPLSGDTTYTHRPDGLKATETDGRSYTTDYTYNGDGYLILQKGPQPDDPSNSDDTRRPKAAYEYDALGRVTRETTCMPNSAVCVLGPESTTVYDPGGNLLSATDAEGSSTTYTYDARGRMLSRTLSPTQGADTLYTYTPTGRPAATQGPPVDPLDQGTRIVTNRAYDEEDRLIQETDPLGYAAEYVCDAGDRLVEVRALDLDGTTTVQVGGVDVVAAATYDAAGNLLTVTDPEGNATSFAYDLLGRVTREADAVGNEVRTAYDDARGLLTSVKSADGPEPSGAIRRTVGYGYDDAGRLTAVEIWDGDAAAGGTLQTTLGHALDGTGNRTGTDDDRFAPLPPGQLHAIEREFDGLDRLVKRTDPFGHTVAYTYDVVGNLTELCYEYDKVGDTCTGVSVLYEYDSLNRLVRVEDWDAYVTTYDVYDAVGNLTQATLPDFSTVTHTYDGAHRLIGIADEPDPTWCLTCPPYNYQATYELNARGQRTRVTVDHSQVLVAGPGTFTSTSRSFGHDAANQLMSATYDADGNMTSGDLRLDGAPETMTYDALNQLVAIDGDDPGPEPDVEYRHDADGYRVEAKLPDGTATRYVYDVHAGRPRLLEERDENGLLKARYVHGIGLISRSDEVAAVPRYRVYHFDGRGSTVALTNPAGGITDEYRYTPYGGVLDRSGPLAVGTVDGRNPFTYNGRDGVFDDGNGLYFLQTRYYAPELMVFVQRDAGFSGALEDTQSLNRYAFVRGDPVNRIDPNGEWGWALFSGLLNTGIYLLTENDASGAGLLGAFLEGTIAGACPTCGWGSTLGLGLTGGLAGGLTEQVLDEESELRTGEAGKGWLEVGIRGAAGLAGAGVGKGAGDLSEAAGLGKKLGPKAAERFLQKQGAGGIRASAELVEFMSEEAAKKTGQRLGATVGDFASAGTRIALEQWLLPAEPDPPPSEPSSARPSPPISYSTPTTDPSGEPSPCH